MTAHNIPRNSSAPPVTPNFRRQRAAYSVVDNIVVTVWNESGIHRVNSLTQVLNSAKGMWVDQTKHDMILSDWFSHDPVVVHNCLFIWLFDNPRFCSNFVWAASGVWGKTEEEVDFRKDVGCHHGGIGGRKHYFMLIANVILERLCVLSTTSIG